MKLLVLYEELAGYFITCISTFSRQYKAEIHIIHRKVNPEAPFAFSIDPSISCYVREENSDANLVRIADQIGPDAIFCGGWASPVYLTIAGRFKGRIPVILGFDTKWDGSFRQQLARLVAPSRITSKFDACFVPGSEQKKLALRIGFREEQITTGAYSCDYDLFHSMYLRNNKQKSEHFPRRFIYVGRYYEFKGVKDLWRAFIELQQEKPNEWELWCLGTGDITPVIHDKIKHFGFVQPEDMAGFIGKTGVFVLPSHFEPWAVVVHEFAAAGFPLVCSDAVGARTRFVQEGENGYIYKAGQVSMLKGVMKKIMEMPDQELLRMAEKSAEKAKEITPITWSAALMKLIVPAGHKQKTD